jgi:hypothetical protein
MTNNKAREINSPVIKQLLDETTPEELAKIDAEMTNNKQQTAVDSIIELCKKRMFMEASVHQVIYLSLIKFCEEQAKEMEKEKHEKFNKFLNDEKQLGISDLKTIERIQWYYNTYFNEPTEEVSNDKQ